MSFKTFALAAACAVLAASGAVAATKTSPVKTLMNKTVVPSSTLIFAVGGEADPGSGTKVSPARWNQASAAAGRLKAAAHSMQKPPMAVDQKLWKRYSAELAAAADKAQKAAVAKNGARFSQAANDMGESCSNCHAKYQGRT